MIQASIDPTLAPDRQFAIGAALHDLRARGVLIIASGITVHNLWLRNVPATGVEDPTPPQKIAVSAVA